jgi:hypothetical protein
MWRGYTCGRKAWNNAKGVAAAEPTTLELAGARTGVNPGGRPRKIDDDELVAAVSVAIQSHCQETCDLIQVRNTSTRIRMQAFKTTLTCPRHSLYLSSEDLLGRMSFSTFRRIMAKHFQHVRYGRRLTDVCDHCALHQNSILPTFWKDVKQARLQLESAYAGFMAKFDASAATQRAAIDNVPDFCGRLRKYMNQFIMKNRESMTQGQIADVHELTASIDVTLKWSKRLLDSFAWHSRVAERQRGCARALLGGGLEAGSVFIWYDWMQSLSVPMAHEETATMFFAPSRHELAVFGMFLAQRTAAEEPITMEYVVIITDVLDHTSEFAAQLLAQAMPFIHSPDAVRRIYLWGDCGKHFRSYFHVGNMYDLFCAGKGWEVAVCFFAEKHGKGRVDALFAHAKHWIRTALMVPDTLLSDLPSLVAVCRAGAARDALRDPLGPKYHVVSFSPQMKPVEHSRMEITGFSVEKTYCILLEKRLARGVHHPLVRNYVFADRLNLVCEPLAGVVYSKVAGCEQWRRGHYTQRNWDRAQPTDGSKFTLAMRMDAQIEFGAVHPEAEEPASHWERRNLRRLTWLAHRRQQQQRVRDATKVRASGEPDVQLSSDSSNSSVSSSSTSSETP